MFAVFFVVVAIFFSYLTSWPIPRSLTSAYNPTQFVTFPVSLALFYAVLVLISLHYLFPKLILPFILLFFVGWYGRVLLVSKAWLAPLPDHWHHLSFKQILRKFFSKPAHCVCSLARGWSERLKTSKELTSFLREPNVLSLQLLLALEARDQERGISAIQFLIIKAQSTLTDSSSKTWHMNQSNQVSQEYCFSTLHCELLQWGKIWKPSALVWYKGLWRWGLW